MNTASAPTPPFIPPLIVERDDGMWSIGFHDDAGGPFPSRLFAVAVLAQEARRARVAVSS